MKKKLLRGLSVLMAFTVLLSSTGFGMVTHTCKFTQKKAFFISDSGTCCDSKAVVSTNSFRKSGCCSVEKSFNKISVNQSFAAKLKVHQPEVTALSMVNFLRNGALIVSQATIDAPQLANPPPLFGRNLLISIQSFVI